MVEHHTSAVDMAKAEVDTGKNADAIALAKLIVSSQTEQITQMKDALASGEGDVFVPGKLRALIPGQQSAQMLGQGLDRGDHRVADGVGAVPVREVQQHHVTGGPLNQSSDGAPGVGADDEVALPSAQEQPGPGPRRGVR